MGQSATPDDLNAQRKSSAYERTVADFLRKEGGLFALLTDDQSFVKLFRSVLTGRLGFAADSTLLVMQEMDKLFKTIMDREADGCRTFVLIERLFRGRDMTPKVREIKTSFPRSPVLVLTTDVERNRIVYLHEVGADNFIAKPVSSDTLVEKTAFTPILFI
ncbi:MAG: hypothetical protein LBQ51_06470 [Desulfovibrio sp.]|jgi:DNA-binding NarL/FixJ family response regulator|nr:hypothetical protein [Desulfovibrio sp.]